MKLTKETLKRIIKEELAHVLSESEAAAEHDRFEDNPHHAPLYNKIVEMLGGGEDAEETLSDYIYADGDDWEVDYLDEVESKGLDAVAMSWIKRNDAGALGDQGAKFAAQDRKDSEDYLGYN